MSIINDIIIILRKIIKRILTKCKRAWKFCDVWHFAMRGYKPFKDSFAFKSQLQNMFGEYDIRLIEPIKEEEKHLLISSAEECLRHEFNLLGSGVVKLDPIDWHSDFKKGVQWEKKFYQEITKKDGADIKVPWELSRCQHLLWLGEAYLLTGEGKYAKEVLDEINWWIDDNPFMYSVNWVCAMDVAFRAVNWLAALNMIAKYEGFDDFFANKVYQSLWLHGVFIRSNLEKIIPESNNHYASNIVGLLYIGCLFVNVKKGRAWFNFALKEYYSEIEKQVYLTGVHYERSISYHRLMTELLSYPIYMLKRKGIIIPEYIIERIHTMYAYVSNYSKPNGSVPLVADNDDGRFMPFLKRDFYKHNYLNDPNSVENQFVSHGFGALFCAKISETQLYKDAGVAIVHQDDDYLFINNGGYSKNPKNTQVIIPTHTHNDLLSFELSLDGVDIIVDSGTYLYTSSKIDRDIFRTTSKHNTIIVDGEEQNFMGASFSLKRNAIIGGLKIVDKDIEGSYQTIAGGLEHIRKFSMTPRGLIIYDTLNKKGLDHSAKSYLHLASGISPIIEDNCVRVDDKVYIEFEQPPFQIEVNKDFISPTYGVLLNNYTIVVTYMFSESIKIKTSILKY